MISNILTPKQLWNEYDPYKEPLRPSYLDIQEEDSYYHFTAYINGDSFDNEPIRIYVQCYIPKKSSFNTNLVLITDVGLNVTTDAQQINLAKKGYGVFSFDYSGINHKDAKYTHYPKAINYANYAYSKENFETITKTAKDTPIFIWSKVCRKVVNLVKQTRGDDSQIILAGYKYGADIAWQVAAMDKRIDGIVAFLNAGWKEFKDYPKFSSYKNLEINDSEKSWLSACSTQAYIKFVNCPALILAASNSTTTSLDRLVDSINLIKANGANVCLNISSGQCDSITKEAQILFTKWVDSMRIGTTLPKLPKIVLSEVNGSLIATADVDKSQDIERISIHYSYDEIDSSLRSWSTRLISLAGLKTDIPIYNETKLVFAFTSVKYKNGFELSSIPSYIEITPDLKLNKEEIKKSRIIFQKSLGITGWLVEQSSVYVDIVQPKIQQGPLNIYGITSSIGNLSTYTIGEYKFKCELQNLLQFDACSKEARSLVVEICSEKDGKYDYYYSTINLPKNNWTKFALKVTDFKTKNLIPLKDWGNIKKLTFIDVDNTLINNILWI